MLTVHPPKSSSGTTLRLKAPLGTGAFSSVWLAEDLSDDPLVLRSRRSLRNLRQGSLPLSRNNSLNKVRVPGVRPVGAGKQLFVEQERSGTSSSLHPLSAGSTLPASRIVALKMTARSMFVPCSDRGQELQRDRTRVSFVREVEVLRHISHPNITKLLTHLTTPSYHVLVLPYISGGDLLGLVNSDEAHNQLGESLLRRMWCELCKAIGWMHGVGLVHRDVKLENILLTAPFPFGSAGPPTGPLIKLTDFGLSRFIDTAAPMLSTRCGSEAYAAPELVISGGKYDARETDAWACGVVLYALCVRRLPFGEGAAGPGDGGRIGREGGARAANAARRHWLMSIARGEWEWPEPRSPSALVSSEGEAEGLRGWRLVESQGARRIVARLLVRERSRREKITELWNDQWMGGKGTSAGSGSEIDAESDSNSDTSSGFRSDLDVEGFDDEDLEEEDDDVNDDGLLLDQDGIDNIARQEVQ
ncbi:kinase-like protein [Mycena pura]|uniref:Kinase-like protein n=1 Tax=Mycena pura TaxID=153505 RepID=A0AAD6YJC2_9AGAR|nr:kinase-like protein [Mycena pura]